MTERPWDRPLKCNVTRNVTGLAPGYGGLYQVNFRVPDNLSSIVRRDGTPNLGGVRPNKHGVHIPEVEVRQAPPGPQ